MLVYVSEKRMTSDAACKGLANYALVYIYLPRRTSCGALTHSYHLQLHSYPLPNRPAAGNYSDLGRHLLHTVDLAVIDSSAWQKPVVSSLLPQSDVLSYRHEHTGWATVRISKKSRYSHLTV